MYHVESPRPFINPLPKMGMHPVNFQQFMGFKQKSHKLWEIYGMHAHARWGGGVIILGKGALICILHRVSYCLYSTD